MTHWLGKYFLVFLVSMTINIVIADNNQDRAKLKEITSNIQKLQKNITHTSKTEKKLNRQLQDSEILASKLQKEIDFLSQAIEQLNIKINDLSLQRKKLSAEKEQQQSVIIREIKTSYHLGKEQTLKLLLNQQDPEKFSRALKYHDYFLKARAQKLQTYVNTLQSLEKVTQEINTNRQLQINNRSKISQQKRGLLSQQQKRQKLLTQIRNSIKTDEQRINQLLSERKRLTTVIDELSKALPVLDLPKSLQPFSKQKGAMIWPTKGKIKHRFGSKRNTRLNWDGWLISAPEGASVKAIHHGRVVFADYLRGQGMLIIVDHGDGYMSLYAHNQLVLKETGDWVKQGEAIAKVGNTGGRRETALYFEIRHNGKPTNPSRWLSKS